MAKTIGYLDAPVPGWFAFEVMRTDSRSWEWVALMVDVDPDKARPAMSYARQRWLKIPGKHQNRDAAWEAFEGMIAIRH